MSGVTRALVTSILWAMLAGVLAAFVVGLMAL